LIHEASDGAWNMAIDEAILQSYVRPCGPPSPTLRLYGWESPTLSLGKGQSLSPGPDLGYLRRAGVDLVRRPTGGRAVLHARERTYALIGAAGTPPFSSAILDTYLQIARALEAALRSLGIESAIAPSSPAGRRARRGAGVACFGATSAHEITVNGRKLIGSAQLRRRGAFLQHGSIPLVADDRHLVGALGETVREESATDLCRCLGGLPSVEQLDRALIDGFRDSFSRQLRRGELREQERELAAQLRCWKYDSTEWTLRGRMGRREQHWGPLSGAR
jgi:lipoate-protein ligase A